MKILKYSNSHNIAGAQIKMLRKQKGLTQEQVVAHLQTSGIQIDQKAISRIENGARIITDYELMRFAETLNVSVDTLIQGSINAQTNGQSDE